MDNNQPTNTSPSGADTPTDEQPLKSVSTDPFGSVGFEAAPSGEPIEEPEPETEPVPTPTAVTPPDKSDSKKTIALIIILALVIIGAAIAFLVIFKPFDQKKTSHRKGASSSSTESGEETPDTPSTPTTPQGTIIDDETTITMLQAKTATILSAGAITEASDSIMTDTYFNSSNTLKNMTSGDKIATMFSFHDFEGTTLTPKELNDLSDDSFEAFGLSSRNEMQGYYFASYDTTRANDYALLFGSDFGNPGTLVTSVSDHSFVYDDLLQGIISKPKDSPGRKAFYLYSYTADENQAYVYFAAASGLFQENSEEMILYSDYDCLEANKIEGTELSLINPENYENFAHYRLVFKKDPSLESNYIFEKLEKL